ncbi:protein kinase domain-containing protein [Streptacidiphilus griseoplanus]|uniref:protein kinase domain-containing protein n=1 Tax=Peterkaempfera griseoplana TaxID=66896 RepID=UPI0007C67C8B|nr:protein kinase [Peterkaempfera griseoplana]
MAQTPHTGDGDRRDTAREQSPDVVPGAQDATHDGRTRGGAQDTPHTPAGTHGTGGLGRSGFGAPGTPGQGTEGDFGTVGEGRYQLTRRLGRGGMAEVFAAQDLRLGRTVAVKLLRTELAQDDVARQRFTREAHSVASLNHHAVVAVYDTGEEELPNGDSMPYIVMELVEGRTVRDLLVDEEAPPVDQALIIIAGVLEALAYSHRHGIVHRDIKPANVIITTAGAVKVMDFGIARALTGAASTMTQTGMVMGTPQYLSPEQALGKAVDHRSDLYATGCMLYELLTLRPPFTGDTPLSVVYQHVQDNPVPPSQAHHRVPPQLDGLVLRSLAKNPDERFQNADEFRAHVQQTLRELHGGTGAGRAAGAAVAGLAAGAAGAAAPTGANAVTEQFHAATPPMGSAAPTAMGPGYRPYDTPAGGYGHGGPGAGIPADAGDEPPRRRSPLLWLALAAAAAVAVVAAILASQHSGTGGPNPGTTAPTAPSASSTSEAPSETATTPGSELPTGSTGTIEQSPGGVPQPGPTTSAPATSQPPTSQPPTSPTPSASPSVSTPPPSATESAPTSVEPSATPSGNAAGGAAGDPSPTDAPGTPVGAASP